MDEQLDKDLKNRIREVFENYQDPGADQGWAQLRKKFPGGRERRRAWMWWGAAAAVLLLFLGIGLWISSQQAIPAMVIGKRLDYNQKGNAKDFKGQTREYNNSLIDQNNRRATTTAGEKESKETKPPGAFTQAPAFVSGKHYHLYHHTKKAGSARSREDENPQEASQDTEQRSLDKKTTPQMAVAQVSDSTAQGKTDQTPLTTEQEQSPAKNMASLLAQGEHFEDKKENLKTQNVHFGVYAATYFNYAKGSSNSVNIGVGLAADLKISKNLRLVSGIAIAQNTLSFASGNVPAISQSQFSLSSAVSSGTAAIASASSTAIPLLRNYNASLVGLDIPVNIKYEFTTPTDAIYVLAGLSSGTFINQTYTYQYSYFNSSTLSAQQGQNQIKNQSFSSFYFAKMLNLAVGLGYPLGKNHLVIEPFLKYPLDGLGAQNIRFGSGGVNLKFNFLPKKK